MAVEIRLVIDIPGDGYDQYEWLKQTIKNHLGAHIISSSLNDIDIVDGEVIEVDSQLLIDDTAV